jgi:hypothetical protein
MTPSDERDFERVPPDDSAWREASRRVADRNDEARKAGKDERAAHERNIEQLRRAERERGNVYR